MRGFAVESGVAVRTRHGERRLVAVRSGPPANDDELILRARSGDFDAFAELITRYRRLVTDVCLRLTANLQDAEDAVQETQLAVWRAIGRFEGRSKFSTWLYQVSYRTALGQRRRRVPEPVACAPERAVEGEVDATVTDGEAVRWALAKLPDDYRVTLVLKECLDLPVDEVAEILMVSEGTVKSRLSRARHALAHLLKEQTPCGRPA